MPAILSSLEEQGLVSHDDQSITILDAIGLRRLACGCYSAMKRAYIPEPAVEKTKTDAGRDSARVLRMRPGAGVHAVRFVHARSAPERSCVHPRAG